jgi:hypothetical protein
VPLLAHGSPPLLQQHAAGALGALAACAKNAVAIAAAGVIPRLVQLLAPGCPQKNAAALLGNLAGNADTAVALAAAGAIPPLVEMLESGPPAMMAVVVLRRLAEDGGSAVAIADAGAILPLVQLLGGGSDVNDSAERTVVKSITRRVLRSLSDSSAENRAANAWF